MLPVMEYKLPLQMRLLAKRVELLRKLEVCLEQAAEDERYANSLPRDSVHEPNIWRHYAADEFAAALVYDQQISRLNELRISAS